MTEPTRITHWIDGKPFGGVAERTGEVYDPATGALTGRVDFADRRGHGRGRRRRQGRLRGVGHDLADQAHQRALRVPRAAQRAQGGARRDHHRRARQGALRRARRGHPRPRGRRVRLRHPAPAQGRLLRERLDRRRRLLDPPAARRRRHHLAVQLPGDGPDVVLPDRDRRGQHRRRQAEREGPVGRELRRRRCGPRPACPTACSTSCTATRSRSTRCSTHPDVKSISFVGLDRRSRSTSTRPAPRTASGSRRSAARRTTWWCCPTPTSTSPPTPRSTPASARPASAAWRSPRSSRSATSPTSWSRKISERMATLRTGDGRRGCDMGPLVTAVHRDKVTSYVDAGEAAGATLVVDGRDPAVDGEPEAATGSARRCSTTSPPTCRVYTDEIFGPVLSVVRVDTYDEALRPGQRPPVRQRHRDLHQRRRRRAALPERGRGRHGRHQRADPGADGLLLLRRLEVLAVRRHATRTAPRACTSSPAARSSPAAGSTRATAASTWASRPTAEPRTGCVPARPPHRWAGPDPLKDTDIGVGEGRIGRLPRGRARACADSGRGYGRRATVGHEGHRRPGLAEP